MTSGSCSTICSTGSSRRGIRGTASTICCTVRRRSRSCGQDRVAILSGRDPPGSSSKRLKSSGWGVGASQIVAVYFISRPHTQALAVLCPLEEWCADLAKAIATVIRSSRNMERSRRSLRRCAAPELGCSLRTIRNR